MGQLPWLERPAEMRLMTSKNSVWSLAVGLTAVLYALEMEPRETTKEAAYRMNNTELWDAATDLRNINIWFSWASYIKEIDKSALGRGKRLQVGYRILPFMGDYTFIATVTEFKRGRVIALEGNNLLRPKFRAVISASKR